MNQSLNRDLPPNTIVAHAPDKNSGPNVQSLIKVRVWDLPVRLFHWTLVSLIISAVVTAKIGGQAMEWHFRSGYSILVLVIFRICWGFVGSRYARFSGLIYKPSSILRYLFPRQGTPAEKKLGHNPVAALSVFVFIFALLAQAVSGLFSSDDISDEGPLAKLIMQQHSEKMTWYHSEVGVYLLYVLIAMHISAIAYYYFGKKENLVMPMITGDKKVFHPTSPASDSWAIRLLALTVLVISSFCVYYIANI